MHVPICLVVAISGGRDLIGDAVILEIYSWCNLSIDSSARQADFMGMSLVLKSNLQSRHFLLHG